MRKYFVLICLLFLGMTTPVQAATPERVTIGAYINDIQEIDLRTHSYRMDVYVWFRWHDAAFNPWKTAEFMNAYNPNDHTRTPLYEAPQKMPDGSLYMAVRHQGEFSVKFPLQKYPFDHQILSLDIEDSVSPSNAFIYVADTVTMNKNIYLPGYNTKAPILKISDYPYPTNFGDISQSTTPSYSRAIFGVPVQRPYMATGAKIFLPVILVIVCTALIFFVHPSYIEGRLGVAITALLTLVALQLTTASSLPEVDYLLMTDKIYLLSYLFIIGTLLQIVRKSGKVHAHDYLAVMRSDHLVIVLFMSTFIAGAVIIVLSTLNN